MPAPFGRQSRLFIDPYEVDLRLSQLGLSRYPIVEAAQQGDFQRRTASPDEPNGASGYYLWARTLRHLRQSTREHHQWHRGLFRRIPVAYNPQATVAVAVSSGDERTGKPGPDPATKNVKGVATAEAVQNNVNQYQVDLGFEDGVDFFYVLINATDDDGIWVEVSRPDGMDDEGRPDKWAERILIGRVDPFGSAQKTIRPDNPNGEIDILVPRRRKNTS